MRFVDTFGSTWEAKRQWLPWRRRFRLRDSLGRMGFVEGISELPDLVVALAFAVLIMLPILLELVVRLVVLPFVLPPRLVGAMSTPVRIRCLDENLATEGRIFRFFQKISIPDAWDIRISGFRRAGRFRRAAVELVTGHGRGADLEGLATAHRGRAVAVPAREGR
ncbi:hypothetical protein SAMN04487905_101498 [Actinopolyspora xinjiangensis]|uniref:Uncharacterized protein n=1 Tax=Actinopolyspora xinjiangensis TaxID=405564 RepID=A0A1H0PD92_9ACTN|nr:hypothetical protein [Actinopolyspora xinjiangensis]SDP02981.1 hypothetical protein SAMN04487905_101498 [Actinopolyspora xinjiangensis]